MKRAAVFILFCSTTFLMGMEKNVGDVISKLKVECKKFDEKDGSKFAFLAKVFGSIFSNNPLNGKSLKGDNKYKELYKDLVFFPRHLRNNEDYKNLGVIFKFVSDQCAYEQNKSVYEMLRKEKEKYSLITLHRPLAYSRNHDKIGSLGTLAFGALSGFGVGYFSKKWLGQSNTSAIKNGVSVFSGAISPILIRKVLQYTSSPDRSCSIYAKIFNWDREKEDECRSRKMSKLRENSGLFALFVASQWLFVDRIYSSVKLALNLLKENRRPSLKGLISPGCCCFSVGVLGAFKFDEKLFHPYEKKLCEEYEKKKRFKELQEKERRKYEQLEGLYADAKCKANASNLIFVSEKERGLFGATRSIREPKNDKLYLLDLTIKTTDEDWDREDSLDGFYI